MKGKLCTKQVIQHKEIALMTPSRGSLVGLGSTRDVVFAAMRSHELSDVSPWCL